MQGGFNMRYEKGFAKNVLDVIEENILHNKFRVIRELELYKKGVSKDTELFGQGSGMREKVAEVWYGYTYICDVNESMPKWHLIDKVKKNLYYKLKQKNARTDNSRTQ